MTLSRGAVLLVAALSALSWNFLFIPPLFTLHIDQAQDALMFATYFIVALAIGNLTSRLKAREHLAARLQIAVESERLRKALLDCVSHELKTPIAAIGAASQELEKHPELSTQLAAEIRQGSQRLNRVVNNLLDMTRLESGAVRPKLEWWDVRELLRSAIEAEKDALGGREVQLNVPDDLPLMLLDFSLIEEAVAKLVANAGTYTPPQLVIEVAAQCRDGQLFISVSDKGPGLPAETELVFEKFHRGDHRRAGGLGLGLSIARGFVEAHGGTLSGENLRAGGARFTIALRTETMDRSALEESDP
jgi:two-component system sensor histidine kinase KdpD